jgi:hypothetical protein
MITCGGKPTSRAVATRRELGRAAGFLERSAPVCSLAQKWKSCRHPTAPLDAATTSDEKPGLPPPPLPHRESPRSRTRRLSLPALVFRRCHFSSRLTSPNGPACSALQRQVMMRRVMPDAGKENASRTIGPEGVFSASRLSATWTPEAAWGDRASQHESPATWATVVRRRVILPQRPAPPRPSTPTRRTDGAGS